VNGLFSFDFVKQVLLDRSYHGNHIFLCAFDLGYGSSAGAAVELVREHAVNVNFALGGLNWKLVLETTAATAHQSAALIPKNLNPDSFFSTLRAREEFRQMLLRNANNFPSSSPHHPILLYRRGHAVPVFDVCP
jgi:hypothetical protein